MMKFVPDLIAPRQPGKVFFSGSPALSVGFKILAPKLRAPIQTISEFFKMAIRTSGSTDDYPGTSLSSQLWEDTYWALEHGMSLNPVLQDLSQVVRQYRIERSLIDTFFENMELYPDVRIYPGDARRRPGSNFFYTATLMCLSIFTDGNEERYEALKPYAISLAMALYKTDLLSRQDTPAADDNCLAVTMQENTFIKPEARQALHQQALQQLEYAKEGVHKLPLASRLATHMIFAYYRKKLRNMKLAEYTGTGAGDKRVWDIAKAALLILAYIAGGLMMLFYSASI